MNQPKGHGQPPRLDQFVAALGPGLCASQDPAAGAQARLFCSQKPDSIVLVVGDEMAWIAPWLLDGLAITGKLVVNVRSTELAQTLAGFFDAEIRFAVHCQDCAEFCRDIHRNRFDLIAVAAAPLRSAGITPITSMLMDRGTLLLDHSDAIELGEQWNTAAIGERSHYLAAVPRPIARNPGRRGGRRGRLSE